MMNADYTRDTTRRAFTLIELLASMAILGLIMVMLFSAFEQISKAWTQGESRVETFTEARAILDLMSRELSQAILTPQITFRAEKNAVYFVAPVNVNPANHDDLCEVGYVFDKSDSTKITTLVRKLTEPSTGNANWNFYGNPNTWWNPTSFDAPDASLTDGTILNLDFQYLDSSGALIVLPITLTKLPYAIVISMDVVDSRTLTRLKVVNDPTGQTSAQITKPAVRNFTSTVYLPNALP